MMSLKPLLWNWLERHRYSVCFSCFSLAHSPCGGYRSRVHKAIIEGLSLGAVPPGLSEDDINLNESSQNPSLFGFFFRLLSLVVIELDLPFDSKQAEVFGESFLAWNETIFKDAVAAILTALPLRKHTVVVKVFLGQLVLGVPFDGAAGICAFSTEQELQVCDGLYKTGSFP